MQGKYLSADGGPKEARLNKYKGRYAEAESRYGPRPNVTAAVQAYVSLAQECGISPTALALRLHTSPCLQCDILCMRFQVDASDVTVHLQVLQQILCMTPECSIMPLSI